ncbi:hypothetical protein MNBD_NITROSPIRAE01-221 [hydrothermal vent metagenome]|uniref:Uncharacterized protein n=1 Tax=hydrothermal vent metagenome TaxID=652676 RepID=A0A3B1DBC8_9ZZZZ
MRPGIKQDYFILTLVVFFSLLSSVRAAEKAPLASEAPVVDVSVDAGAKVLQETLLKTAYFHFFVEDYMSAATHLRLVEDAAKVPYDEEMINRSRLLLGSLYLAWGMDRPATRIINELIGVFPSGEARNDLLLFVTRMQYERGLYQTALETYRLFDTVEGFSQMDEAVYIAGMSHYALGFVKEAVVNFRRIAPESLYYPYAQLTLAQSYFFLEDSPKALRLFEEISQYDPQENAPSKSFQEKSRLLWGQFLIEEGHYGKARSVLSQISKDSRFFPDALFARAWSEFKGRHFFKAILIFQDLIKLDPSHPYALESLTAVGHAYNRLKAYQTALDRYAEAIDLYKEEEARLRDFMTLLDDPLQVIALIDAYNDDASADGILSVLLTEDEGLRYWVSQYGALSSLDSFLDQKLRDMSVFEVMVDHRETVFLSFVPEVDRSLSLDPVSVLQQKSDQLNLRIQRAVNLESLSVLTSLEEAVRLGELKHSQARRTEIALDLERLEATQADPLQQGEIRVLQQDWEKVSRWFQIIEGELSWKVRTEIAARADDRQGALRRVNADLSQMAEAHAALVLSVPRVSQEIAAFRARIADAQVALAEKKEKTLFLQAATLPALKAKLLAASDRRLRDLTDLAATAELSQIQILDIQAEETQ